MTVFEQRHVVFKATNSAAQNCLISLTRRFLVAGAAKRATEAAEPTETDPKAKAVLTLLRNMQLETYHEGLMGLMNQPDHKDITEEELASIGMSEIHRKRLIRALSTLPTIVVKPQVQKRFLHDHSNIR